MPAAGPIPDLGPSALGRRQGPSGRLRGADPLTKARPHVRMTHSVSLGVRGRLLQVSTLWSIGPVMPHSASTGCDHPQHWMWLVLAPRKEPFRSTTLRDAIMKEKQDHSQTPFGSFWKSWRGSFAGGQGRLTLTLFILGQLATAAGAFVRRRRGGACVLHGRSGPSVTCVKCTPSASTPWPAAKTAIVPGRAPTGPPPRSATGTTGSAGEAWGLVCRILSWEGKMLSAPTWVLVCFPLQHCSRVLPTQDGRGVWSNWSLGLRVAWKSLGRQVVVA